MGSPVARDRARTYVRALYDRYIILTLFRIAAGAPLLADPQHSHIFWWQVEHESQPTADGDRRQPHRRDAVVGPILDGRIELLTVVRVSVIRRSSIQPAGVRRAGLWGPPRPHNRPHAVPAWARPQVTPAIKAAPPDREKFTAAA